MQRCWRKYERIRSWSSAAGCRSIRCRKRSSWARAFCDRISSETRVRGQTSTSQMTFRLIVVLLLASFGAAAQEIETPPPMTTVVVPIVGRVLGANDVHWRTEVELRNDQRGELNVV